MTEFFLADDLSGALDAAAAFHGVGREVKIVLSRESARSHAKGEVVGFTTETRSAKPAVAAREVQQAIAHGRERGARIRYKKIDSTLRGPVAAELEALAAALPGVRILFTPANPAVGRTVRDGILFVHGVPVAETAFARDPANPVTSSSIREILGRALSSRVTIADALTESDLRAAVTRMTAAGDDWIGVGSGALARAIAAEARDLKSAAKDAQHQAGPAIPAGPVLMVCGSAHPANRAQAKRLAADQAVAMHDVAIADPRAVVPAALANLESKGAVGLLLEGQRTDSSIALQAIVAATTQIMERGKPQRIFMTGGETAFAWCREAGVAELHFLEDIEPGLSLSWSTMRDGRPVLLAVKPGGFGDERTWSRAWERLRARE